MRISVTFRHMESSEALRQYATEKTERLGKYLFEPVEVHWVLSVEKIRHIADATIVENGVTIKAQEETHDMYSAIDLVLDKLDKQVKRHKEKVKDHKSHTIEPVSIRYSGIPAVEQAAVVMQSRIVKKENRHVKPMSVEEAAMQMDVLTDDFLVFTDSSTSNINVIYRLADKDYGLIETHTK